MSRRAKRAKREGKKMAGGGRNENVPPREGLEEGNVMQEHKVLAAVLKDPTGISRHDGVAQAKQDLGELGRNLGRNESTGTGARIAPEPQACLPAKRQVVSSIAAAIEYPTDGGPIGWPAGQLTVSTTFVVKARAGRSPHAQERTEYLRRLLEDESQ